MKPVNLADRIVKQLFVNGVNQQAERLVLTTKDGRDLGGWCRGAVRDIIESELREVKRKKGAKYA